MKANDDQDENNRETLSQLNEFIINLRRKNIIFRWVLYSCTIFCYTLILYFLALLLENHFSSLNLSSLYYLILFSFHLISSSFTLSFFSLSSSLSSFPSQNLISWSMRISCFPDSWDTDFLWLSLLLPSFKQNVMIHSVHRRKDYPSQQVI